MLGPSAPAPAPAPLPLWPWPCAIYLMLALCYLSHIWPGLQLQGLAQGRVANWGTAREHPSAPCLLVPLVSLLLASLLLAPCRPLKTKRLHSNPAGLASLLPLRLVYRIPLKAFQNRQNCTCGVKLGSESGSA